MTTKTPPTADTLIDITSRAKMILPQLEEGLTALSDRLSTTRREVNAIEATYAACDARVETIRRAVAELAVAEPAVTVFQPWRDFLVATRKTLCDELLALPPRIRTSLDLGKQQNLMLSIASIDSGLTGADAGYSLQTLRLGALMREAGVSWHGSLPDSERRLTALHQQRDDARARLTEALLDDPERERRAAEHAAKIAEQRARGRLKVRSDGSQFLRFSDGRPDEEVADPRVVEVSHE